jgi:hypothetical protein
LILLLGAWGGLVPFIGPYFNFTIGSDSTWHWTSDRLLLSVLPAVAAVLGGLILIGGATRAAARLGGLLALAGGIWFVIGPTMSMLWNHGVTATGPALGANGTRVIEWIGYFYGTGALIVALAAFAIGMLTARPVAARAATAAEPEPVAQKRPRRSPLGRFRRTRGPVGNTPAR